MSSKPVFIRVIGLPDDKNTFKITSDMQMKCITSRLPPGCVLKHPDRRGAAILPECTAELLGLTGSSEESPAILYVEAPEREKQTTGGGGGRPKWGQPPEDIIDSPHVSPTRRSPNVPPDDVIDTPFPTAASAVVKKLSPTTRAQQQQELLLESGGTLEERERLLHIGTESVGAVLIDREKLIQALRTRVITLEEELRQLRSARGNEFKLSAEVLDLQGQCAAERTLSGTLRENISRLEEELRQARQSRGNEFKLETELTELRGEFARERARHEQLYARFVEQERKCSMLMKDLSEARTEAIDREEESRQLRNRLSDFTAMHEVRDAAQGSCLEQEKQKTFIAEDRIRAQADMLDSLERRLNTAQQESDHLREANGELHTELGETKAKLRIALRDQETCSSRVRQGALVDGHRFEVAQSEVSRLTSEITSLHRNNVRLLSLIATSKELGGYLERAEVGEDFFYCGIGRGDGTKEPLTARQRNELKEAALTESAFSNRLGRIVDKRRRNATLSHLHDTSIRTSGTAQTSQSWRGPSDMHHLLDGAQFGSTGVMATQSSGPFWPPREADRTSIIAELVSKRTEREWWIPRKVYDATAHFLESNRLPLQIEQFFPLFLELNKVWYERLDEKRRADSHIRQQHEKREDDNDPKKLQRSSRARSASPRGRSNAKTAPKLELLRAELRRVGRGHDMVPKQLAVFYDELAEFALGKAAALQERLHTVMKDPRLAGGVAAKEDELRRSVEEIQAEQRPLDALLRVHTVVQDLRQLHADGKESSEWLNNLQTEFVGAVNRVSPALNSARLGVFTNICAEFSREVTCVRGELDVLSKRINSAANQLDDAVANGLAEPAPPPKADRKRFDPPTQRNAAR